MELQLRVSGEVGSLYRWLLADPDVAGFVQDTASVEGEEDLGGFEVINTLVANAAALSSLVVSILAWRSHRRPEANEVRIEHNGVSVVVRDPAPETVAAITAALADPVPVDDEQAV
ncbi:effector-associated constant component EACC1 [Amycolatopsis sp. lyj-23]|uniref:effector-associated constant component EACC1 n=1 Tax=Amycolatopsis sp. lyj-23 TaxID=2789283 RepID=UPI00397A1F44